MFLVKFNVGLLEVPTRNLVQVPEPGEPGEKGPGDGSERISKERDRLIHDPRSQEDSDRRDRGDGLHGGQEALQLSLSFHLRNGGWRVLSLLDLGF